jgi:L-ascorbate metabolism protein UlaG (beta-lactamase superfamily)
MHYGTFPPIEQDANAWAAKVGATGVRCEVLEPGGSVEF